MIKISPSILASDFSRLGEEIKMVEAAGADMIHVDVMDGHFVPNITIGPPVLKCLARNSSMLFDVHLMIENAQQYLDSFIDAGAGIITVHAEACTHLNRVVQMIKKRGVKASVSLNPATPLSALEWIIEEIDMVLLMTVNPGFGGQSYIPTMTGKISALKEMMDRRGLKANIQVDGGIDLNNIYEVTKAGANVIVAGTTIFSAGNYAQIIAQLREKAYDPGKR